MLVEFDDSSEIYTHYGSVDSLYIKPVIHHDRKVFDINLAITVYIATEIDLVKIVGTGRTQVNLIYKYNVPVVTLLS